MSEATAMGATPPGPVETPLLRRLLDRLQVPVAPGALEKACAAAPGPGPMQQLAQVFRALRLAGASTALVRWPRFDQRRLPALVHIEGQWRLATPGADGGIVLEDGAGASVSVAEETLADALVAWVRVRRQQETAAAPRAAALVLEEMFRSRRWLADVMVATVMVNLLAVATSLFAMQVYDRVVPTLAYTTLWALVAGMGVVVALDWVLKTVRARVLDSVSCAVDQAVSQRLFDHVMHLQLDTRPRSLGTLAAQIGGLDSVRQFFSSGVVFALVDLPFALMFIAFIAAIGGPVAWVYVLLLPVAGLLGWVTQARLRTLMRRQMTRANERQGLLVDTIQGAESIRTANAGWRFCDEWQAVTSSVARYALQQKAISNLATVTTASLSSAAYVAALVVGVGQIEAGALSMGALIACSILGGRVIAPVAQSIQYLAQWQGVAQALRLVDQVLALSSERRPGQGLLAPEEAPTSVSLHGVRFCYPESPVKQLEVDELVLRAGARVALLGTVGSGKSTLLKVLAGLYRPTEGRVRLGEADLWEVDPAVVADHVAYLPQSVDLFKGTLRSNLVLAGAVSDSQLLRVCTDLGIDRIAEGSPRGMDHEIYEGGGGLSGGQRQLVGLGRVFLARPRVWLLDEPTAALDLDSEKRVLDALRAHVRPEDILVVATHRPVLAASLASRVLRLEGGRIVEDGPPDQVMAGLARGRATPAAPLNRPGPGLGVHGAV